MDLLRNFFVISKKSCRSEEMVKADAEAQEEIEEGDADEDADDEEKLIKLQSII